MIDVAVGSLSSDMSQDSSVRDMAESETDCSEGLDEVVMASLPLDPFPPKDFRGKFKKMRHKKRPTILESRCCFYWTSCCDLYRSLALDTKKEKKSDLLGSC